MNPLDIMAQLLGVDRRVGGFVLAGLGLLAASAIFISWRIEPAVAVNVALRIAGLAVLTIVLSRIHGVAATLLAWLLVLLLSAYAILFAVQTLCDSCLRPPVMQAGCFPNPFQRGCPLAPAFAPEPAPCPEAIGGGGPLATPPAAGVPAVGPEQASRVFIQFAGALSREAVIELAQALTARGWPVQGADRGGERITSAFGLNEVRFFHPEDAALARALADELGAMAGMAAAPAVADLSRAGLRAPRGQLEVWISRR